MTINESMIENLIKLFENTPEHLISSQTNFRDLQEWDSLMILSIIAMLDREYGYKLQPLVLEVCKTFGDLISLVEEDLKLKSKI